MEYYKFNQSRCLVNLSNSILAHFGVKPFHHTLLELDEILKNHNKVAVVLFDGLNSYIKKELLNENDALIKHSNIEIDSVFPPTTVAATTAFLSGKFPYENGWLGWCQHFNDLNVTLEMFTNNYFKKEGKYHLQASYIYCPYKSIITLINENTNYKAFTLNPKNIPGGEANNLPHFFELLDKKLKGENNCFLYAYWPEPDSIIHENGVHSRKTRDNVKYINKHITRIAKQNKDTLFLIISDHGLIDVINDEIDEHQDLFELINLYPSLDSRATMFIIKDNKQDLFQELFNKYYGNYYQLLTKTEVLNSDIFGHGIKHPQFENFIGDFLAISTSNHAFHIKDEGTNQHYMSACHAGGLEIESKISIAIFNK